MDEFSILPKLLAQQFLLVFCWIYKMISLTLFHALYLCHDIFVLLAAVFCSFKWEWEKSNSCRELYNGALLVSYPKYAAPEPFSVTGHYSSSNGSVQIVDI